MRTYRLEPEGSYTVDCITVDTANGFKHIARLYRGGTLIDVVSQLYINRTWELFEYETVLKKIINDNFTEVEKSHISIR